MSSYILRALRARGVHGLLLEYATATTDSQIYNASGLTFLVESAGHALRGR